MRRSFFCLKLKPVSSQTRLKELRTLHEITALLNKEAHFSDALPYALNNLIELVNLKAGWIFLAKQQESSFELAAYTGLPPALNKNNQAILCKGGCECQGMFDSGELDQGVNTVSYTHLTLPTTPYV